LGTQVDVDAGLVAGLRGDDPAAAVRLVERYGERVYRLAARITGTRDDAEDAARSALMTAVRMIDAFKSDSSFGSWMDRLAASAAYRKLLARPGRTEEIALDDVLPPLDGGGRHFEPMSDWSGRIDAWDAQGELRQILTDAVDALPPEYRVSLILHDGEGMSNPDIAEALGIGVDAVRTRVHRARLFLRKGLSDHLDRA
jgi:RNA polymerase sigma-70 factor, ECF subfamily